MNRYLTPEEEKALFKTVTSVEGVLAKRDGAWMLLLRQTGMRIGNLATLTVAEAQAGIKSKSLALRDEASKRNNGYTIFLNKTARQCLRVLLSCRVEQGFSNHHGDQALVMSRNHRGMSIRSFQSRMRHWADMACLTVPATPHWFRHTLAINILKTSTHASPLTVVKDALGHHSLAATGVYTQPTREEMVESMEQAS